MGDTPLNRPGDSIRTLRQQRLGREVSSMFLVGITTGVICGAMIAVTLVGTWPAIFPPVVRWTVSILGLVLLMGLFWWCNRLINAGIAADQTDRSGIRGERLVADAIDELVRIGYRVFHDVPPEHEPMPGERLANFDHILIGPGGVFVVETKARNKPGRGKAFITVDHDGEVLIDGVRADPNPLVQTRAVRTAVKSFLERETGMSNVPVRGVLTFPGWYVRKSAMNSARSEVWVLNPMMFVVWVRNERRRLNQDDIARLSSRIREHVERTTRRREEAEAKLR